MNGINELCAQIKEIRKHNGRITVLTGAGISTDSGIPDFRSKGTGLWEKVDPMEFLSTKALVTDPKKFYEQYFEMVDMMSPAVPNDAHRILADLEEKGIIQTVITQNIDGLHQAAGSKNVLEIHGNIREAYCPTCEKTYPLDRIREYVNKGQKPFGECDHRIRPSVVLFGDSVMRLDEAFTESSTSNLVIAIGTSLSVFPAANMPMMAIRCAIINRTATEADKHMDYVVRGEIAEVLKIIREAVL